MRPLAVIVVVALWAAPGFAADLSVSGSLNVSGNAGIRGTNLCVGNGCGLFGGGVPNGVTIRRFEPQLTFMDTMGAPPVRLYSRDHDEFGFFVEVGELVPFAIRPTGFVGIGTEDPRTRLHVQGASNTTALRVENQSETAAARYLLQLVNQGPPHILLQNTANGVAWDSGVSGDNFVLNRTGNAGTELILTSAGNLTIKGTLTERSDRDAKRDIMPVDAESVLSRVAALPITTWRYKDDPSDALHLGPMAQDFHAAFGFGADERHISPRDAASVALAAIKALAERLQQRDAEIAELKAAVSQLVKTISESTAATPID